MSQSGLSRNKRPPLQGSPEPIAALNRITIQEYAKPFAEREPLVDIRAFCPGVAPAERICPFLRLRVAEMLNAAQDHLPTGYRFRVGTALRTLSMQAGGWDRYYARMREEHPTWPLSALRRATNKYFAPYDQKAPPGHCTGGAVDVVLLGPDGEPLDVVSPTQGWEAAYTWSDKISADARANRMIMVEAMLGAGFSNCRDEYWHYSWGDSAWAVRVGEHACPYGWTHPPVCLEPVPGLAASQSVQIETLRDPVTGRALRAEGACVFEAGQQAWGVGLLWAKGVPVSLRIETRAAWDTASEGGLLYVGPEPDKLQPLPGADVSGDTYRVELTPEHDRTCISNRPSPAVSAPA